MSLLRQAVQCFANQQIHRPLNAFIASSIDHAEKLAIESERADVRLESGITVPELNHFPRLFTVLQALRNLY